MNPQLLRFTIATVCLILTACGGTENNSSTPVQDVVVTKKTINVDNVDQAFQTYLLYRYRLTQELDTLLKFRFVSSNTTTEQTSCPLGGNIQNFSSYRYIFDGCETSLGKIIGGRIDPHYAVGPAHTTWFDFTDLNYQLVDDAEPQKLDGTYTDASSSRLSTFRMSYTRGTTTQSYTSEEQKINIINIKTTAIAGNQNFQLAEFDEHRLAITPILSAEDGANLTIVVDTAGAAVLNLRNEKNGVIILNKTFSKAEVDAMLLSARKAKVKN